jgi:cyclopropane-fatty-acyl-phospholipid synthase
MEQIIPRTLRRWENYQSQLCKSAVLGKLQTMTRGHLALRIDGEPSTYSFGYGQKIAADILVHQERFFQRFLRHGELGFGASYVEGDWDTPDLVQVLRWFLLNTDELEPARKEDPFDVSLFNFLQGLGRFQDLVLRGQTTGLHDSIVGQYALERPFFQLFLDSGLHNSGALFAEGDDLEAAQLRKQRRLVHELRPEVGDHILELGCGWGGFALYLALCLPCKVTAVTISEEQHRYLCEQVKKLKLEQRVFPLLQDFRQVKGTFDRIVSVELIDSLSAPEWPQFFQHCDSLLKSHGIMVHQLLLSPDRYRHENQGSEWIQRYISPGMATPSLGQVLTAMNRDSRFCVRRVEDIGLSYAKTVDAWRSRFEERLAQVRQQGFRESFIRSWRYYLAFAEAAFEHGLLSAAQLTMTRPTERWQEQKSDRSAVLGSTSHLIDD